MKKVIVLVLALVMALTLCSCGAKVECDFCGNEVKEKSARSSEMFGETAYMCDDCYTEMAELFG